MFADANIQYNPNGVIPIKNRMITSSRKKEHLDICCNENIVAGRSGFDDVRLIHNALPECNMDAVDLSVRFLHHQLKAPIFIAAMTGGHPDTKQVNATLATAAEEFGLAMGVGSQRAALENPEMEDSFTIVRERAPHAFLCGNLGIVQLRDKGLEWADKAVEMIDAQALCIHLNPLQEAIQPEGDHDSVGCLEALRELCSSCRYPVIVKETGCGISWESARQIFAAGASAVDVGGLGGTSWAAVEQFRAENPMQRALGMHFADWGIPTAVSVSEAVRAGGPVIATGGLNSGTDIAKAMALGASMGGMALALLQPAMNGYESLSEKIKQIQTEIRVSCYLTGSRNPSELLKVRKYITGITREMLKYEE
jgi:isopentenyl-diphosphate delta-isomerase